jgi:Transposase zinc-binding domain
MLDVIVRCRTAALGGHRDQCVSCGHQVISYNSCRGRNCPKCQGNARAKWLAARSAELLPVPYFHIVFTLPHELSALILRNKRLRGRVALLGLALLQFGQKGRKARVIAKRTQLFVGFEPMSIGESRIKQFA